jgi:hypothetical protein
MTFYAEIRSSEERIRLGTFETVHRRHARTTRSPGASAVLVGR